RRLHPQNLAAHAPLHRAGKTHHRQRGENHRRESANEPKMNPPTTLNFDPLRARRNTKNAEEKTSCILVSLVDKTLRGLSWMIVAAAALTATGCSSGPKMAPGKSAAEIAVKAEPKKGYHPPSDPASYAGGPSDQLSNPSASAGAGPLTLLDYNALYGIVVWLEPTSGQIQNANP